MSKFTDMLQDLDKELEKEVGSGPDSHISSKPAVMDLSKLRTIYANEVTTLKTIEASLLEKQAKIESALAVVRMRKKINTDAMKSLGEF